jgi:hypothetical protein
MTSRQSIMVNNVLFFEEDPSNFLSTRQIQIHDYIESKKNKQWISHVNSDDFRASWKKTTELIANYSKGKVLIN